MANQHVTMSFHQMGRRGKSWVNIAAFKVCLTSIPGQLSDPVIIYLDKEEKLTKPKQFDKELKRIKKLIYGETIEETDSDSYASNESSPEEKIDKILSPVNKTSQTPEIIHEDESFDYFFLEEFSEQDGMIEETLQDFDFDWSAEMGGFAM